MPFRWLNVSATITQNTLGLVSNLTSPVWSIIVPMQLAFFNNPPFNNTNVQILTWAMISLILKLPLGILIDILVHMVEFIIPSTSQKHSDRRTEPWNYNKVLWRSTQLYMCSFAYSVLAIMSGKS